MNYWDHCIIVFRYPFWVVVSMMPIVLGMDSAESDNPGSFVGAVFLQTILILCFYLGLIK